MTLARLVRGMTLLIAPVAVFLAFVHPVSAITWRVGDTNNTNYINHAADYTSVGIVWIGTTSFGSGTLIAPDYVLTAAHVVGSYSGTPTFTINGETYTGSYSIVNPNWSSTSDFDWDIALIHLSTPVVGVDPTPIYTATDELTKLATYVGYGYGGDGVTGYYTSSTYPANGTPYPFGTKRACDNIIDRDGTYFGFTDQILLADFDNGTAAKNTLKVSPFATANEGAVGKGDSGGGMFITVNNTTYLAGVITGISTTGVYGDCIYATRVSSFAEWINQILSTGYGYNVYWTGAKNDLAFATNDNWTATCDGNTMNFAPRNADLVHFNLDGTYTITWPDANVTNAQVTLDSGNLTFNLYNRTYFLTASTLPSLIIGTSTSSSPSLTIINGTLSAQNVTLSSAYGASGSLTIGTNGTLLATGLTIIGNGTLDVCSGRTALFSSASGLFSVADNSTFTKTGLGQLVLSTGGNVFGSNVSLFFEEGETILDLAAGTATTLNGNLSIGSSAVVRLEGGGTLCIDGILDLGGISTASSSETSSTTNLETVAATDTSDMTQLPTITVAPEPATLALMLGGGLLLLATRRRHIA